MHDLVLTACCGYPLKVYDRFLGTLYGSGFNGRAVMFVFDKDLTTVEPLRPKYPKALFLTIQPAYTLCIFRYQAMLRYLEDIGEGKVRRILLCDSRDVLFQRNLSEYELPTGTELVFFAEDAMHGSCRFNDAWTRIIQEVDKSDVSITGHRILCSGTTLGTYRGILEYIKALLSFVKPLAEAGRLNVTGLDQGIHNHMYYRRSMPKDVKTVVLGNEDGLVNTLGYGHKQLDEDGRIVNAKGDVSWICHQYDRLDKNDIAVLSRVHAFDFS